MIAIADMGGTLHDTMSKARFFQYNNQGTDSTTVKRERHRAEYVRTRAVNESPFTIANVVHVELEPNVNTIVVQPLCKSKYSLLVVVVYFEFRFHFLYFLKNSCAGGIVYLLTVQVSLLTCSTSGVVVYLFNFKNGFE